MPLTDPRAAVRLCWKTESVSPLARPMLRLLGEEYAIRETLDGARRSGEVALRIELDEGMAGHSIRVSGGEADIRCGRLCGAGRAVGTLLSGLAPEGASVEEGPAFATLGALIDCGHNGTVRPAHVRKWLRRMSLLGYNMLMVYTEAGYELPGEPAFGYMRGRYSASDMKALDDYAAQLGIEMVGAIQALGHLEQTLKWPAYAALRDTEHTLLVGEERTYELIDKMVGYWGGVFRSRRLHLGMDETYDLGRGKYLDRNGYRRGLDIYSEHLKRVAAICERHGLRPMIWSDVLFKLASAGGGHYDTKSEIPPEVVAALPKGTDLVYWDYYNPEKQHYLDRIASHRALGAEPVMASAVWSWATVWHNWTRTETCAGPCVDACREAGLKEMIFTLWSDDGAFWELDSALAGVVYAAEKCHGAGVVDGERLARRFAGVCLSNLAVHREASGINDPLASCSVMWDDPLASMFLRKVAADDPTALGRAEQRYLEVARALEPHRHDRAAGDLGHAWLAARFHALKTGMAARLFAAYAVRDRKALAAVRDEAPVMVALIEELAQSFRALWMERCEPLGLEVLQIRFAGQAERYRELARRIGELLEGETDSLPELDEAQRGPFAPAGRYRALATGARVF